MTKIRDDHVHLRGFHIHQTQHRLFAGQRGEINVVHLRKAQRGERTDGKDLLGLH